MKGILVTGATGFAGLALCRRLRNDGEQVIAFTRPTSNIAPLKEIGVECRVVDIRASAEVDNNFSGIDKVYHVAAAYRTEHIDQNEFRQVNVEATRNLLESSRRAKVKRFIHCSTVGVQGEIKNPPASEDYRYAPGDHYQESKKEGELLALKYFKSEVPGVVVRPVGLYGPGDTRFLKLFRPINKGWFVTIGAGNSLYHMTYIDDLIDGVILCGTKKEALGEIFTIAGEKYTTLGELVNTIADLLGKPRPWLRIPYYPMFLASVLCEKICRPLGISPPLYPRRVEFFSLDRAFSIEKARQMLGYRPRVGLQEGIQRTADWYRSEGLI